MREQLVAKIRRDSEGNWLVSFPEIRGAHTYGRSLSQLRRRIPEVLRLWDHDPAHTEIVEILELPKAVREAIARTARRRQELEVRSREVQHDLETTIERLQSELGLGVRDTGELLGISPQYAHKLRRMGSPANRPARRRTTRTSRARASS
jgi:predicted RNase H-like HicB family nuclease